MKGKLLFGAITSLAVLAAGALPSLAQNWLEGSSERLPTEAEIEILRQEVRRKIEERSRSGHPAWDPRTDSQRQDTEDFVRAWSQVDPEIAPFLGMWLHVEEVLTIYPSNVKGRVCLLYTTLDSRPGFAISSVVNDKVINENDTVIFEEGGTLQTALIRHGKPAYSYDFRPWRPLVPIDELLPAPYYGPSAEAEAYQIIREFKAAGCTASTPSEQ
ncbi:MAG: hypothetical protein F6J93_37125 [Oscillatoria sp. SIO1A7]|nr:hypothetical protein [Oscillatoria sp. SIO1A7]